MKGFLLHPLLSRCGVTHGFGQVGCEEPYGLVRPKQVHGTEVVMLEEPRDLGSVEADGVVTNLPNQPIGVVTADCVPLLMASASGQVVAAVHAGWRGLSRGVVKAGAGKILEQAAGQEVYGVLGPHIGACCYEVDEPVTAALEARFGRDTQRALTPSRPGHFLLNLAHLVCQELAAVGLGNESVAQLEGACTHCQPLKFHSYRRQGSGAGRLIHFIAPRKNQAGQ